MVIPTAQTIQKDLLACTHGFPSPEYAKAIPDVWELAVNNTMAALDIGIRNAGIGLGDENLLDMGDVSAIVDMSVEAVEEAINQGVRQ